MFFEIYSKGKLIKRGQKTLNPLQWENELMYVPTCDLKLPIEYLDYVDGREEVKIYINDKVFWGIVWDIEVDKDRETVTLKLRHVISEWEYRQISVNHAISNDALNIVYKGDEVTKSESNDEAITAHGFSIGLNEAKSMSDAQLIERALASAWVISNGDKVAITSVKIEKSDGDDKWKEASISEEGSYRLTFSTAKGTSVSVDINVEEKYEPDYSTLSDPAVIDKISDIYNDMNFAYPGWEIDMQDDAGNEMIDYVYSRQNKLDALTQTMELTEDLFWRVNFINDKKVEIGKFGQEKPYIVSLKPSGLTNIHIIDEPEIDYDFENVINVATVYSDKSDSGMSSLTLREVYMNPDLQKDKFPVVILHANVNNERDYSMYISQYPQLAPNNEIEYAVLDEESIALESGTVIEGTYSFNDMSPFELDGKTVTDEKRVQAAKTVYERTIRKLIQARRSYNITVKVEEIPADLYVGDKIRFVYDNSIWNLDACSSYWQKILHKDDWFYVTKIRYDFDDTGMETNELTLTKWIRIDRETQND